MLVLKIEGLNESVRLGCSDEERSFPQVVTIDIELEVALTECVKTDSIKDTLDYMEVAKTVETLTSECSWKLIEKMCFDIGKAIFLSQPVLPQRLVLSLVE